MYVCMFEGGHQMEQTSSKQLTDTLRRFWLRGFTSGEIGAAAPLLLVLISNAFQ